MLLVVKNPKAIARAVKRHGFGKISWTGHGNPLQYSCLESPIDRQAIVHGVAKSQTRLKWLSMHPYHVLEWWIGVQQNPVVTNYFLKYGLVGFELIWLVSFHCRFILLSAQNFPTLATESLIRVDGLWKLLCSLVQGEALPGPFLPQAWDWPVLQRFLFPVSQQWYLKTKIRVCWVTLNFFLSIQALFSLAFQIVDVW